MRNLQDVRFGGKWTEEKLEVLRKYIKAYADILAKQRFKFAYIDAFAGAGYRTSRGADEGQLRLDFQDADAANFFVGSTRIALADPRFFAYIFIEKDAGRAAELEALKEEFSELAQRIQIRTGDANTVLQELAGKNWRERRALVFLDPFGMQVSWRTVEALAGTQAVDVFYLFPLGIGVNRLLTRDGRIDARWKDRLTDVFGTRDWETTLYHRQSVEDLFGETSEEVERASIQEIGRCFLERLRSLFPHVADPLPLYNSTNCPMYLLCFAAANPRGGATAVKIANEVIKKLTTGGLPKLPRSKPEQGTLF